MAKYDDIYVLLSSDLPLFALRKYTPGRNGLLVKLEANNERVYYSYHPRVCERVSERRAGERGGRARLESRRKEERKQRKMHSSVLGRPFQLLPPPEFISDSRKISRKDSRSQFGAGLH